MKILVHICCAPCFTYVHKALRAEGLKIVGFFYNPNIHPYQEFLRRLHCLERYTALRPVEVIYDKEYNLDKYLLGALKVKYDPDQELLGNKAVLTSKHQGSKGGFQEKVEMKESFQIQLTPRDPKSSEIKSYEISDKDSEPDEDNGHKTKKRTADSDFNPRCGYCIRLRLARTAELAVKEGFDAFTTTLLESRYQPHDYIRFIGEKLGNEKNILFYYQDFRNGWKESIKISKELELYRQPYCGCIFSEYERFGPKEENIG